jgi:mono/diheme cytochrome c family protein
MSRRRAFAEPRKRLLHLPALILVLLATPALRTPAAAQSADHGAVFEANCSMCHQLRAVGVPGQFPRLAGRADRIAATAAGRLYLERVVLFGLMGNISVDHTPIVGGVMPSFSSLTDEDLAQVLDYIVSLDGSGRLHWQGTVFKPADIAKARAGKALSPTQVHQARARIAGARP